MKVRVSHTSLQFKDSDEQHAADVTKIFKRAVDRHVAWLTGTEAGPGSGNTAEALINVAASHGYHAWVPSEQAKGGGRATDCWIAVRDDLISGNPDRGFLPAVESSDELYRRKNSEAKSFPRWGPKGLVYFSFDCDRLDGRINIGAAHYLTKAHHPDHSTDHGVNRWELNEDIAEVIGKWAKHVGKGHDLVFYAGDQNMLDAKNKTPQGDTFFGEKMTSLADELSKWQNTGHGSIDVIASYNRDGRVKGVRFKVLDDREFRLHTDHYHLEGVFDVVVHKH